MHKSRVCHVTYYVSFSPIPSFGLEVQATAHGSLWLCLMDSIWTYERRVAQPDLIICRDDRTPLLILHPLKIFSCYNGAKRQVVVGNRTEPSKDVVSALHENMVAIPRP